MVNNNVNVYLQERPTTCPNCGKELPPIISVGLCPKCFLSDIETSEVIHESDWADQFTNELEEQGYLNACLVGRGGMGWVYKAIQSPLDRNVAVKLLMPGLSMDRSHVNNFLLEARSAANLQHPNILPVYEVGDWNGAPYHVSKWLPEGSLADWIQSKQNLFESDQSTSVKSYAPDIDLCLKWISQVAEAVESAHQSGIIHRDLKPSNILLDEEMNACVADFGLAEFQEDRDSVLTTKVFAGTPQYMAPELLETNQGTIRSDVYSIGMIFYELLTGSCPYDQEISFQLFRAIIEKGIRSPSELNSDIPISLAKICMKCLEKNPDRRYESAHSLLSDLHRYQQGYPVQAEPSSAFQNLIYWTRRNPLSASMAIALLLITSTLVTSLFVANYKLKEKEHHLALEASRSKLIIADQLLENHRNPVEAVLQLVDAVRLNPENKTASYRLLANLMYRPFPDLSGMVIRNDASVSDIALDPKNNSLISTGHDSFVKVWDLGDSSEPIHSWKNSGLINEITTDVTHRRMAVGSVTLRPDVLDLNSFERMIPLRGHSMLTYTAVLHPSGTAMSSGSLDGRVHVWNLPGGSEDLSVSVGSPIYCLAFDRDGSELAAGSKDGMVNVWKWPIHDPTAKPTFQLPHPKEVSCILYVDHDYKHHPNLIVTGCHDGYIRGWDKRTGELRWTTKQSLGAPISSIIFASTEKKLARIVAAATNGNVIGIWTLLGNPASLPMTLPSGVTDLEFLPNTNEVFAALENGRVVRWTLESEILKSETVGCGAIPVNMSLSPNGDRLLFGTTSHEISSIQATPLAKPIQKLAAKGNLTASCFINQGQQALLGFHDHRAEVWNIDPHSESPVLSIEHEGIVLGVAQSDSGKLFASYDLSGVAKIFTAGNPPKFFRALKHPGGVNGIIFLEEFNACVTVSNDNHIRYWDLTSTDSEPIFIYQHNDHVRGLDLCMGKNLFVSGSSDFTVALHDFRLGFENMSSKKFAVEAKIDKVKITSNGDHIVATTGSPHEHGDFNLILWNLKVEPPVKRVIPMNGYIQDIAFNSNQKSLATSDWSGTARIWDLESGIPMTPSFSDGIGVNQVEFSPDDSVLYTASNNATIKEWPLPPAQKANIPEWFLNYVRDHINNNFSLQNNPVDPEDYSPSSTPHDDFFVQLAIWLKNRQGSRVFKWN